MKVVNVRRRCGPFNVGWRWKTDLAGRLYRRSSVRIFFLFFFIRLRVFLLLQPIHSTTSLHLTNSSISVHITRVLIGETSKLLAEKAAPYINRVTGPFSHLDEYESLTKNRALIRIALMVFFESLENASHRKRCKNVERRNVQRVPAWYARAEDYFTRENKSRSWE